MIPAHTRKATRRRLMFKSNPHEKCLIALPCPAQGFRINLHTAAIAKGASFVGVLAHRIEEGLIADLSCISLRKAQVD